MDAGRRTMDFFEHQGMARKRTGRLVVLYVIAMVLICGSVAAVAALIAVWTHDTPVPLPAERLALVVVGAAAATAVLIGAGSLYRIAQLRSGGGVVADSLGGRLIGPNTADPAEQRALHVVEEMAIASGVPVPPVYIMPGERGINAFAAGYTPGDAVIGLTRGCVEGLTREELQGVVAHEFSHILNGDMRLNIRLIGLLNGIVLLSLIGTMIVRSMFYAPSRRRSEGVGGAVLVIGALGVSLLVIGGLGSLMARIIQAAVSRQREFLADASAVQFTRNPQGISDALRRIGGSGAAARLTSAHAREMNHMLFGEGVKPGALLGLTLASHPPLPKRITRIDPAWDGTMLTPLGSQGPTPERPGPSGEAGPDADQRPAGRSRRDAGSAVAAAVPLMALIGAATPAHIEHARHLIESIPAPLRQAAHEPFSAVAVVYALLLDPRNAARPAQVDHLTRNAGAGVVREVLSLAPHAATLDRSLRLPLLDMTLPALARLSPDQHTSFRAHIRALVRADRSISFFEWVTVRVLERHLDERFGLATRAVTRYYALGRLGDPLSVLFSAFAHVGARNLEQSELAFRAAAARVEQPGVRLLDLADCGLDRLDAALDELRTVAAPLKRAILTGCAACVAGDRTVTAAEAELLRAVADVLGVPAPPLLPGQALV